MLTKLKKYRIEVSLTRKDKTVEYLKQPLAYDIMPVGKMTEMLIERMKLPEVAALGSFYSILGRRLIP